MFTLNLKKMFKKVLVFITVFQFLFCEVTFATSGKNDVIAEYMAKSVAGVISEQKTYESFLTWMATHVNPDDVQAAEKFLKEKGINKKDKMPIVKVKGNKVVFSGGEYIVFTEKYIDVNGNKFYSNGKSLAAVLTEIDMALKSKKVSFMSFMIPEAHAIAPLLIGALGLIAGVALVKLFDKDDDNTTSTSTTSESASYIAAGTSVLASAYLYDRMSKDCNNNRQPTVTNQRVPGQVVQYVGKNCKGVNRYYQQRHPGTIVNKVDNSNVPGQIINNNNSDNTPGTIIGQ